MTTPANQFGPYWNKVPIEAINVGLDDLPEFAVAEIVDSYRPEASSSLTFGGGRTVLQVKTATTDSPNLSVTVGPVRLKAGGSGPVFATVESFARFTGTVAVGDSVGVAMDSYELAIGQSGYFVIGDIDTDTGICRVMRVGGGGGLHDIGFLLADCPHLQVGRVYFLSQVGMYDPGETIAPPFQVPGYVDAVNITKFTMRAGTALQGPYMIVERINRFEMPRMFPDQVELCVTTPFQQNPLT